MELQVRNFEVMRQYNAIKVTTFKGNTNDTKTEKLSLPLFEIFQINKNEANSKADRYISCFDVLMHLTDKNMR